MSKALWFAFDNPDDTPVIDHVSKYLNQKVKRTYKISTIPNKTDRYPKINISKLQYCDIIDIHNQNIQETMDSILINLIDNHIPFKEADYESLLDILSNKMKNPTENLSFRIVQKVFEQITTKSSEFLHLDASRNLLFQTLYNDAIVAGLFYYFNSDLTKTHDQELIEFFEGTDINNDIASILLKFLPINDFSQNTLENIFKIELNQTNIDLAINRIHDFSRYNINQRIFQFLTENLEFAKKNPLNFSSFINMLINSTVEGEDEADNITPLARELFQNHSSNLDQKHEEFKDLTEDSQIMTKFIQFCLNDRVKIPPSRQKIIYKILQYTLVSIAKNIGIAGHIRDLAMKNFNNEKIELNLIDKTLIRGLKSIRNEIIHSYRQMDSPEEYFEIILSKTHLILQLNPGEFDEKSSLSRIDELTTFIISDLTADEISNLIKKQNERINFRTIGFRYLNIYLNVCSEKEEEIIVNELYFPHEIQEGYQIGDNNHWNKYNEVLNEIFKTFIKKSDKKYSRLVVQMPFNANLLLSYYKIDANIMKKIVYFAQHFQIFPDEFKSYAKSDKIFYYPWSFIRTDNDIPVDDVLNLEIDDKRLLFVFYSILRRQKIEKFDILKFYNFSNEKNYCHLILHKLLEEGSANRELILEEIHKILQNQIQNEKLNDFVYKILTPKEQEIIEKYNLSNLNQFIINKQENDNFKVNLQKVPSYEFVTFLCYLTDIDENEKTLDIKVEVENLIKICQDDKILEKLFYLAFSFNSCSMDTILSFVKTIEIRHDLRKPQIVTKYSSCLEKFNKHLTVKFFESLESCSENLMSMLLELYIVKTHGNISSITGDLANRLFSISILHVILERYYDYYFLRISISLAKMISEIASKSFRLTTMIQNTILYDPSTTKEEFKKLTNSFYPINSEVNYDAIKATFDSPYDFPPCLYFNSCAKSYGSTQIVKPVNRGSYGCFIVLKGTDVLVNNQPTVPNRIYSGQITFKQIQKSDSYDTFSKPDELSKFGNLPKSDSFTSPPFEECEILLFCPTNDEELIYKNRCYLMNIISRTRDIWKAEYDIDLSNVEKKKKIPEYARKLRMSIPHDFKSFDKLCNDMIEKANKDNEMMPIYVNRKLALQFQNNLEGIPYIDQVFNSGDLSEFACKTFPFKVEMVGEGAIDSGGPRRQIFTEICKEILNPNLEVFCDPPFSCDGLVPIPCLPNNDTRHRYTGFVIAACCAYKSPFPFNLNSLVFDLLANENVSVKDIIMKYDKDLLSCMRLFRSRIWTDEEFQQEKSFSKTGNCWSIRKNLVTVFNKKVTKDNYLTYLQKVAEFRLKELQDAMQPIIDGFCVLYPLNKMKLYPSIIKLLSCGDDDIPSKVFKKHLVYKKIDLPLINMLVNAFSELSPDEKHQLLIFITGSATISPYSTDKITVEKAWSDSGGWNGYLPRASTCFKTLYLPEYDSTEIMIDKLRKAMYECLITDNYRYFDDSIFENDE